jgi:hypothetical protein
MLMLHGGFGLGRELESLLMLTRPRPAGPGGLVRRPGGVGRGGPGGAVAARLGVAPRVTIARRIAYRHGSGTGTHGIATVTCAIVRAVCPTAAHPATEQLVPLLLRARARSRSAPLVLLLPRPPILSAVAAPLA